MPQAKTEVEYVIRCGLCGQVHREQHVVGIGEALPNPAYPEGWQVVNGFAICKAHTVKLVVDGHRTIEL